MSPDQINISKMLADVALDTINLHTEPERKICAELHLVPNVSTIFLTTNLTELATIIIDNFSGMNPALIVSIGPFLYISFILHRFTDSHIIYKFILINDFKFSAET